MKTYEQALKELNEKYAKAQEVNTADVEAVEKAISALESVSTASAKDISPAVKWLQAFVYGEKYCTRNRNKGGN